MAATTQQHANTNQRHATSKLHSYAFAFIALVLARNLPHEFASIASPLLPRVYGGELMRSKAYQLLVQTLVPGLVIKGLD